MVRLPPAEKLPLALRKNGMDTGYLPPPPKHG